MTTLSEKPTDKMIVDSEEGDGGTDVLSKSNLAKKTKDCHEIVKTSAVAGERRGNLCSVHQNGIRSQVSLEHCQRYQ
uniref:Uncharacterized protein n=1 Tax=Ascaris lumbricoides TaxID=6252 RepID=A0A0M3HRN8_ASCLU